ncbi:MAG: acyltransferase family protein [Caulobacteraceae bacterium]
MNRARREITFDVLNGLRGIAAIAVVNTHLQIYFGGFYSHNIGLAVDFFFLLSGFVLTHAYEARLRAGFGFLRFAAARAIRLYPLYLAGLLIGAGACWFGWGFAGPQHFAVTLATGLVMLPPPPPLSANGYNLFPFDFAAWSLFFELAANLLYGLIAPRLSNRVLGGLLVVALLGLVAAGLGFGTLDLGAQPKQILGGLAQVMFSFFAGVALYRLWLARPVKVNTPPVLLFGLLILPLLWMPNAKEVGTAVWVYDLAVIVLYFPVLLSLAAQSRGKRFWTWASAVLGAISYPLYVLHVPIWALLQIRWDKALAHAAPWSGFVMIACLLPVCWAAETLVDVPLRQFLNRRLLGRRSGGHRSGLSLAEQEQALAK